MKKELGFYDYSQLSANDQYDLVFKEGVFFGGKRGEKSKICSIPTLQFLCRGGV